MRPGSLFAPLLGAIIATACGGQTFTTNDDAGATGGSTGDDSGVAGQSASGGRDNTGGNGGVSTGGGSSGGTGGATGVCENQICEPGESCSNCVDCCETGGAGGMTTGGAGGMATGGVGGMGTGGDACSDPDGANASVRATAAGLNGTFTDECDVSGNLVEYVCETIIDPSCLPNPDPSCIMKTGDVLPSSLYCAGRCMEGTCEGRCPQQNDRLTYLELQAEGTAVFRNENDGHIYWCEIYFNDPMDPYECGVVGDILRVASLGLDTTLCVPGPIGYIGIGQITGVYACTYYCTVAS